MTEKGIRLKDLLLYAQKVWSFLLHRWKVVLICAVIGAVAGLSYAIFSPTRYEASVSFVTETDQNMSSGFSSYAGLAAQFGIDLGNGNLRNSLFSGDNIYDLMKTRKLLENTLLTPVTIDGKKTLLIDRYIEMKSLRKKWENNPNLKNLSFDADTSKFSLYQNQVISSICKSLVAENLQFPSNSASNGSSLMSVSLVSMDEQFSALFITNLIDNLARYYVNTTTKRARTTLNTLDKQLDSIRSQLYGAMSNVASFQDKNLNLVRQGPRVSQQKSSLRMQVNSAIYQQLVTAVETARMNLQKETPLFEVIDRPVYPLPKRKPGKMLWGIIGLILGGVVSSGVMLSRRFYKKVMEAPD